MTRKRERKRKTCKLIFTMIFVELYMRFVRDLYIYILYKALYFFECILGLNERYFRAMLCTQIAKYMELLNVMENT